MSAISSGDFPSTEHQRIFRVPSVFYRVNDDIFSPDLVALGAFHCLSESFAAVKALYAKNYLDHVGKGIDEFVLKVKQYSEAIFKLYGEIDFTVEYSRNALDAMILDCLFILEFIRKASENEKGEDDPVFSVAYLVPCIKRNLVKLENQVPYLLLELVYAISKSNVPAIEQPQNQGEIEEPVEFEVSSEVKNQLKRMILQLFIGDIGFPSECVGQNFAFPTQEPDHLLDLLRMIVTYDFDRFTRFSANADPIRAAHKVIKNGVLFKPSESRRGFMDITFSNRTVSIPEVRLSEVFTTFLFNALAFEQLTSHLPKYFSSYVLFFEFLLETSIDVESFVDNKVMDTKCYSKKEVLSMFRCSAMHLGINSTYLTDVADGINRLEGSYLYRNFYKLVNTLSDVETYSDNFLSFLVLALSFTGAVVSFLKLKEG